MKKSILALLVVLVMCFSLTACGGSGSAEGTDSNAGEIAFDEGTVVLENEYVKVELVKFSEETVNWADKGEVVERGFTLKVTNVSDVEIMFGVSDVYVGDEGAKCIMRDGNMGPLPGKSMTYRYHVQFSDESPLESMDQLYELNGLFDLNIMSADGEYIEQMLEPAFDFAEFK